MLSAPRAPINVIVRPGDEHTYIVDQVGVIWQNSTIWLDKRSTVPMLNPDYDERGLLNALFSDAQTLILYYNVRVERGAETHLTSLNLTTNTETLIQRFPASNIIHQGGGLVRSPSGEIYLAVGDGGHGMAAQNLHTLRGQVIEFRQHLGTYEARTIASGLRNPWRISLDNAGRLWVGDVGADDRERIYLLDPRQSVNCGWPYVEGDVVHEDIPPPKDLQILPPWTSFPNCRTRYPLPGRPCLRALIWGGLTDHWLIFGDYAGVVYLWNRHTGKLDTRQLQGHQILGFAELRGRWLVLTQTLARTGGIYTLDV